MEDFGYQKEEHKESLPGIGKRVGLVIAALLSVVCFAYITVSAYYFVYQDKDGNIETVKSPEEPIKIVAESEQIPAGEEKIKINHSIYEDIFGNNKAKITQEETKLRDNAKPAIPQKIVEPDRRLIKEPTTQNAVVNQAHPIQQPEQKIEQKKVEGQVVGPTADSKNKKIIVYSSDKQTEQAQDLLTKTSGQKSSVVADVEQKKKKQERAAVLVQIAAMTSRDSAEEYWKKNTKLYSDLFSGLKSFIKEVDLGKRGIFYRLQIGSFFNQIEAEEFCNRYVSRTRKSRADCIIVE